MKHLDLFSGIGGFALAVDTVWPGSEHIFCDNDLFCQAILKKHWPNSEIYGDIRTLTADAEKQRLEGKQQRAREGIWSRPELCADLLTGGFPCQPFSAAGRRKGTADDRHLWPEMLRVIREFSPTWVIAENVGGLVTWSDGLVFQQVCTDLETAGYEVQPFIIPAVSVNAPHRRDRVWFVANRRSEKSRRIPSSKRKTIPTTRETSWNQNWLEVATQLCSVDDGLPNGLARPRGWRNAALKGAGNAIVPQVAIEIMKVIKNQQDWLGEL